MKKIISAGTIPVVAIVIVLFFSSCLKDKCSHTYKIFTPVYKKLSELRATVQSQQAAGIVNTGKLYIRDKWIFLNEQNKGIHVINNSDPLHPVKASFINIPGNFDLYVKGNTLYADMYCDLVAINIGDPAHITVSKYLTNTFPEKVLYTNSTNPDSINVLTGWDSRDTVADCTVRGFNGCAGCVYATSNTQLNNTTTAPSPSGTAGSMARFAAVNNYMYAVTTSSLNVIDITSTANPLFVQRKNIGWGIETIFPYNNKLYIGAGSSMSVYDLQDPVNPQQSLWSGHWCSHDPIVADDNYAYVTLHAANFCGSQINELDIYSLTGAGNQPPLKTYPLTNPQGLSKDGNLLFVCDNGLKIYDATNVKDLKLLKHLQDLTTYDVIAFGGIAYTVAKEGLFQYNYTDSQNIHLLSKIVK